MRFVKFTFAYNRFILPANNGDAMSRQVEYQERARKVFAIAKEHRDAIASVLPDDAKEQFLQLTGKASGRPSITRNPQGTSPARSPTKA